MLKSRSSSLFSSNCKEEYYIRVKRECDRIDEDDPVTSAGSIQIKYVTQES